MNRTYNLGVLLGDDIGLEVVPVAVRIAQSALLVHGAADRVVWSDVPIGRSALESHGDTLPTGTLETLHRLDGWVLGPIGHQAYPKDPRARNPHPILRKSFDLYANIRPARSYPGVKALYDDVDVVIVRENNEGFPPDRNVVAGSGEFRPTPDVTISVRVITRVGSEKVARAAFELARSRRRHLTSVHKDTVFKLGCGMFADACRELAVEFPDVRYDEVLVDTFAMKLAMRPQEYDVVVTTNLFGDILSDLAAGLVGGLGLAPGLSAGPGHAMAQATHGSAPDIAGQGIANPTALIVSTQLLLDWLGRRHADDTLLAAAVAMDKAVTQVLAAGGTLTRDLGGSATTEEFGNAVVAALGSAV